MSLALGLYRGLTTVLSPFSSALLRARARRGKEDPSRLGERLGRASQPRPGGALVWLHGASVGETLSVLPLIDAMRLSRPDVNLLVTSGTVASAALLAERLPAGVIHQFAPLDTPAAAKAFTAHWRPGLAIFVESEIWPNLLAAVRAGGARTALVSARLSHASLRRWRRVPASARSLFGGFDLVLAQDEATAEGLQALGARDDGRLNLKLAGAPLCVDDSTLAIVRASLGDRPILLAASTHPGEEAMVLDVFAWLKDRPERPLLVIAPRHPVRGEAVAALARAQGLTTAQRSADEPVTGATEAYVADTLGELGLWFRLARVALIGGSLVEGVGGHNPLEAARLRCPAVSGPHVENWGPVFDAMTDAEAIRRVEGVTGLAGVFAEALVDDDALRQEAERASAFADSVAQSVGGAADGLLALLDARL